MPTKKIKFEEQMKRLEEIVSILEKGEVDLDTSLILYEEGIQLSKELEERLQIFEQRITKITEGKNNE